MGKFRLLCGPAIDYDIVKGAHSRIICCRDLDIIKYLGGDPWFLHEVVNVSSEDLEIGLLGVIGGGKWGSGECIN